MGREYQIKIVKRSELSEFVEEAFTSAVAAISYKKKTIAIEEGQSQEEALICLFHEITHFMLFINGVDQIIPHDLQEILCETNANVMYDAFKQIK